jgi:1-phosphofructokinase
MAATGDDPRVPLTEPGPLGDGQPNSVGGAESPVLAVFGPSPLLTITVEPGVQRPGVHLHAGGQGFWVARLAATLGARVSLCCALGGEPGRVLRALIEAEPITLRAASARTSNGVYIHDRRGGERIEIVNVEALPLDRHASDELYGIALAAGLDAHVTVLTGCQPTNLVGPSLYRRLVNDLRANGKLAIADLTGPPLHAVLEGGVELLRLSDQELVSEGYAESYDLEELIDGALRLQAEGARNVLVSRAEASAVLIAESNGGSATLLSAPTFEALDPHGTGDSMFAATAVGLARGMGMIDALRLGMAAGALNVTRRGLGTGTREEIERLAAHIDVAPARGRRAPTEG